MGNLILNSLEIRNFRAFRNLKIEHLGRVNLLVGKNNVGKTSLLEAIQLYAKDILRLNSNETPYILISVHGLSGKGLTELWDSIALTKLETDVLTALRLIAPGVAHLNFVSTPLSGWERIPIVQIADNDEPLPLYSLGTGMCRTPGISLALI